MRGPSAPVLEARKRWRGRYPAPLPVLYDATCTLCRRSMAVIRVLDLLETIEPVPGVPGDLGRQRFPEITDAMLARDVYAVGRDGPVAGYGAWVEIARRIPFLWPLVPLLGWRPVAWVGHRLYRRVADSRRCAVPAPRAPASRR